MKNYRKLFLAISAAGFISVLLSSCLKDKTSSYYNPNTALVTVIQAAPDQPALDLYFDGNRVNTSGISYGAGLTYFQAYAGTRIANFYQTGTQTKVLADTVVLLQNVAYSMFLTGAPTKPEVLLLTDTLDKPTDGNGSIRFVNLSPDAPAVDLVVHGGAVLSANKPYKGYSSFVPVTGKTTYTFDIRKAGTTTVLASLPSINVNAGYLYTIWFYGLNTPVSATDKLAVGITNNAYF